MSGIKPGGMPGHQPSHESRYRGLISFDEQMKMVGHQRPGKTVGLGVLYQFTQSFYKIGSVSFIGKNEALFDTPCHDMMQGTWKV